MHNGSVLIYFKEEQLDEEHPVPSLRAELDVLQSSGSSWLINALMMGRLDEDEDDWALTAADEFLAPLPQHPYERRMLAPTTLSGMSPPPMDIDRFSSRASSRATCRNLHSQTIENESSPSSMVLRQYN